MRNPPSFLMVSLKKLCLRFFDFWVRFLVENENHVKKQNRLAEANFFLKNTLNQSRFLKAK